MSHRPEHTGPPELYYNSTEARKYTRGSRMVEVQLKMTERAVELLHLPPATPHLLLDLGCGSGLSGEFLSEQASCTLALPQLTNLTLSAIIVLLRRSVRFLYYITMDDLYREI